MATSLQGAKRAMTAVPDGRIPATGAGRTTRGCVGLMLWSWAESYRRRYHLVNTRSAQGMALASREVP
jgi:hypothetical protein